MNTHPTRPRKITVEKLISVSKNVLHSEANLILRIEWDFGWVGLELGNWLSDYCVTFFFYNLKFLF